MRKIYFILLTLVCAYTHVLAENCVTVQQVSTNYKNSSVTFDVYWKNCTGDATKHRNTVWVFVDYQLVDANGAPLTQWAHAPLASATPTFEVGTATYTPGNTAGFWLYNTTGKTSRVTVPLNIPANSRFNWCAFATDYPPNIAAVNNGTYTLGGMPSFTINGQNVGGKQYSGTVNSLADATSCPGCIAIRDFKITSSSVTIPCCPNLTKVGGVNGYAEYCRDLAADAASSYTGLGYEITSVSLTAGIDCDGKNCPSGWRLATSADCENMNAVYLKIWGHATNVAPIANSCSTGYDACSYYGKRMKMFIFGTYLDKSCGIWQGFAKDFYIGDANYSITIWPTKIICIR